MSSILTPVNPNPILAAVGKQSLRDEMQAMADAIKARNAVGQKPSPAREFVGPFPIVFALPERMPKPYLLPKPRGAK